MSDVAYRDPSVPVDERVADLLARMTVEEKAAQLACPFTAFSPTPAEVAPGTGGVSWVVAATHAAPRDAAMLTNTIQRRMIEESRLGIPTLFDEEALCGLKVKDATVFPDAIGQGATWDPELIGEMATTIGRHMRLLGVRQAFSPLCDVAVDPRWGRVEETYGADPYLVGSMASAFVRGLQGADPATGTMACLKHYVANSGGAGGRNNQAVDAGERAIREIYGLPFEMAIRLAGARSVMTGCHVVDGEPVQASRRLVTELLRDEYGFEGIVHSDLGAVEQLRDVHLVAEDASHAIGSAIAAGLDLELANAPLTTAIVEAVGAGTLDVAHLDASVARLLAWKFRLDLFDKPYVDEEAVPETLDPPEDRALARTVAERSIVLLRNEVVGDRPLLPLAPETRSIAVIGPNADRPFGLLGNYTYPVLHSTLLRFAFVMEPARQARRQSETGSDRVTADEMDELPQLESVPVVTVLEGIRARAPKGVAIRYEKGCPIEALDESGIEAAEAAARESDVAVVVVGDQSGIVMGATVGESADSVTCALPGRQRRLVERVAATGTPTVVVLTHGRPFVLDWMAEGVPAILTAWFPGEEGGHAVAGALFGDVNPGGKLPVPFPRSSGSLPAAYTQPGGHGNSYYDGDLAPQFPFGHGLSYTNFAYRDLELDATEIPTDGTIRIALTVANEGTVPGDEVVQLYIHDRVARFARPGRELKGFCRVSVPPNEDRRVTFDLSADRVAQYDPATGWVIEPGAIEVMIGSSSHDIRLQGEFTLVGPPRVAGAGRVLTTPVTVG